MYEEKGYGFRKGGGSWRCSQFPPEIDDLSCTGEEEKKP